MSADTRIDWDAVIEKAKANAGEWVLIANYTPSSRMQVVQRQLNRKLRQVEPPLDARMPEIVNGRGDLYVRYTGPAQAPVPTTVFRSFPVPNELRSEMRAHCEREGTTVSAMVKRALQRIAKRGPRVEEQAPMVQLGVIVDADLYRRALDICTENDIALQAALRRELAYEVRGRR